MEHFIKALLITALIMGLVYIGIVIFWEITFRRKIKEAIERIETKGKLDGEKEENRNN